jgi:hypothetical protein
VLQLTCLHSPGGRLATAAPTPIKSRCHQQIIGRHNQENLPLPVPFVLHCMELAALEAICRKRPKRRKSDDAHCIRRRTAEALQNGAWLTFLSPDRWTHHIKASRAANSEGANIVWVVTKPNLAAWVAHRTARNHSCKKTGYILLLQKNARSALLPPLEKRFRAVACLPNSLPKDELRSVLRLADRKDRFIGGIADEQSKTLTLW